MMKTPATVFLAIVSLLASIIPAVSPAQTVHLIPALGDAPVSKQFSIRIDGRGAAVEKMGDLDVPIHYTQLNYDGSAPLKIEITVDSPIRVYSISPRRRRITGTIKTNTLSFTVNEPGYLVVRIDSMEDLFLLINPAIDYKKLLKGTPIIDVTKYGVDASGKELCTKQIQRGIDEAAKQHAVLYFPKGIYRSGELDMKSALTVYLADGALLRGSVNPADYPDRSFIRLTDIDHFQLLGNGTIDGSGWSGLRANGAQGIYLVYASGCSNVLLDGVVLRNSVFWNTRIDRSRNVLLKNLKILNNRPDKNWTNTDGVDFDSSVGCGLVNAVIHSGDDDIVVKGLDHDGLSPTEDILADHVLTMSNSAAAKIGTETTAKYFKNICFRNIDIVRCKRAMVIEALDSTTISNVQFENFTVENFAWGGVADPYLIDFEITDSSWRPCIGKCNVNNVTIANIDILCSLQGVHSQILGHNDEYGIGTVRLKNIQVQRKTISSGAAIRLKTNPFTKGLRWTE